MFSLFPVAGRGSILNVRMLRSHDVVDLSDSAHRTVGSGTGPSAEKAPQPQSHLALGFCSTSSWPGLTSLTAEPTQAITVPAHQTQFTQVQLDTFLGHHPTEKVATKPAC